MTARYGYHYVKEFEGEGSGRRGEPGDHERVEIVHQFCIYCMWFNRPPWVPDSYVKCVENMTGMAAAMSAAVAVAEEDEKMVAVAANNKGGIPSSLLDSGALFSRKNCNKNCNRNSNEIHFWFCDMYRDRLVHFVPDMDLKKIVQKRYDKQSHAYKTSLSDSALDL